MEYPKLRQICSVGGVTEGLCEGKICVGESGGKQLSLGHPVAQIRGDGNEKQKHKPCEECVGQSLYSLAQN